ncbi:MAG: nuclease [Boseongicola sp.]|nr:MAG: nuclease [Boseongicola sp.]
MALNNAWANATLYKAMQEISDMAFQADRPGFFPSIADTLNHILSVDLYYIDALESAGQGRSVFNRADIETASDLARQQAEADMRLATFCDALSPEVLTETCITDRSSGPVEESVSAVLLHLFQHQTHHRGQAHVQMSHAGIAPPQLDEFHLIYDRAPSAEMYWS